MSYGIWPIKFFLHEYCTFWTIFVVPACPLFLFEFASVSKLRRTILYNCATELISSQLIHLRPWLLVLVPRFLHIVFVDPISYESGEDKRRMLAAKDWFRLAPKTDGRSTAWIPEPVKLDTHDEEKMNRVFVLPDHTLIIRNFRPCTIHLSQFLLSFSHYFSAFWLCTLSWLAVGF